MSSASAPGRRPPELDDREWLERRLARDGEMAIALDLHVSRGTVRRAREALGVPSQPPGRRRGAPARRPRSVPQPEGPTSAAALITRRILEEEAQGGPPPTRQILAARVHVVVEALETGAQFMLQDALTSLGAACGVWLDSLLELREAA